MNKAERMRRTENVRRRRLRIYDTLWAWKPTFSKDHLLDWYASHYHWMSWKRIFESIEEDLRDREILKGKLRSHLPNHSNREWDWYIAGRKMKIRMSDMDMKDWLDELDIPHNINPRQNHKDQHGKLC